MITTPISLQDLRRRIYVMAKTDKTNRGFGWKRWSTAWFHERLGLFGDYRVLLGCARKRSWSIGHITHGAKRTGERRTGNPSAPFDEAGAGDGPLRAPRQSPTPRRSRGRAGRRTVAHPAGGQARTPVAFDPGCGRAAKSNAVS